MRPTLIVNIIDGELDAVYSCTTWTGALALAVELIISQVDDVTASEIRQELKANYVCYRDGGSLGSVKVYLTHAKQWNNDNFCMWHLLIDFGRGNNMQWLIISIVDGELDTASVCSTWMAACDYAIELVISQVDDVTASEIRQELAANWTFYSDDGRTKVHLTCV